MAGVGEASAIIGLVSTSVKLSKTVVDVAIKSKNAKNQIEAFGKDVLTLGGVLNQVHRVLERGTTLDHATHEVIANTLEQCHTLFSEISAFKDALYSRVSKAKPIHVTLRGRARWIFEAAELQVLQARIDSTRMNLLLLMTLECLRKDSRLRPLGYIQAEKSLTSPSTITPIMKESAPHIRALTSQCDRNVRRLETLEEKMMLLESQDKHLATDRDSVISFNSATSARSIRDSILNLYSRDSYLQNILSPRDRKLEKNPEIPIDEQRFSRRIEDYLGEMPNSFNEHTYTAIPSTFSAFNNLIAYPMTSWQNDKDRPSKKIAADDQKSETQFPSRAKALQAYAAKSSPKIELSIEKDEILEVLPLIRSGGQQKITKERLAWCVLATSFCKTIVTTTRAMLCLAQIGTKMKVLRY